MLFAALLTGLSVSLFAGLIVPVLPNEVVSMLVFLGFVAILGFPEPTFWTKTDEAQNAIQMTRGKRLMYQQPIHPEQ